MVSKGKTKRMPSSVIAAVSYNEVASTLRIVFVSGAVYEYKKVPRAVFTALQQASSQGTYLNTVIKGSYSFKKVKS